MVSTINPTAQHYIDKIREVCERVKPLVVIHCITYNHEPYLRDALEGFLMQKTDFPFVAIVHEDVSTDGTAHILREYAEKYPDTILPIFEKENQYSKGTLIKIMNEACKATGAKYIAWCEGDDYWTYALKLQKQIDFMESHSGITYTCHRYKIQDRDQRQYKLASNIFLDKHSELEGFEFDHRYVFRNDWVTKTLTSVYRIEHLENNELRDCVNYRDVHNIYQILSRTNGYCFQFVGGVYRKQETGVWSQADPLKKAYIEVKTWESIYRKYPTNLNKWKVINNYTYYIISAIRGKKKFKIENFKHFKYLLKSPIEIWNILNKKHIKSELKRIRLVGLNKTLLE